MEKKGNKGLVVSLIIFIIISIGLAGYIVYDKDLLNLQKNTEVKEENKEKEETTEKEAVTDEKKISYDQGSELLNIVGINNNSNLTYLFIQLVDKSGVIANFSKEDKQMIIYEYAKNSNLLKSISGEDYDYCNVGSGNCDGITLDDYKIIASKYGLENEINEITTGLEFYNNMYLYGPSAYAITMHDVKHEINAYYQNSDIIIKDSINFIDSENISQNKNKTYTFKLNNNNNYYLYSIN